MNEFGKHLVIIGLVIAGVGVLLWSGVGKGWLGRLPGDIHYTKGDFSFHFPLVTSLIISAVLTLLATLIYLLNRTLPNMMFFDVANNIFGDAQITLVAGISLLIGFLLVLAVRYIFGENINVAAAVTWGTLGNRRPDQIRHPKEDHRDLIPYSPT